MDGQYVALEPTPEGWLWSQQLQLFLGVYENQLRFFSAEGQLIPTPEEVAVTEQQRSEVLAAKLRELGIDPDTLLNG